MPNSEFCPRGIDCMPLNNLVSDCKISCICIGKHYEIKEGKESNDIYRHCFYNEKTDSMFDYDEYDLISIISVISNGLLTDKFLNK